MSDAGPRKRDRLMARLRHLWKSWKARKHKASREKIEKRTGNPQTNVSTAIPSNASVLTHIHRKDTPSAHPVTTIESSSEIQAEGTIYNEGVQSDSIISSQQNLVTATEHTADTPVQEQGERTDNPTAASITSAQSLWSKAFFHADLNDQRTTLEDIGFQASALECVSGARGYVEDILKERKAKAWKIDKLLNWIDKFKEIGDIVVQYDPAHAALPWAAFRLLLNICVARHTTLEAIVDGLEYIASLIQRCTLYEIIYEKENFNASENLRESILQLYIAVLKFFAKAIDKVKENHVKAVFTTENISDYLGNVRKLEKTVKDDADLVAAQATRDDFKDLRAQLKDMNDTMSLMKHFIEDSERSSILQWISAIPYSSHHRRISEGRLEGTGEWLFERQEYEEWISSGESKLLLLRGIPGAGKTYIASKVIDCLQSGTTGTNFAYFYCNRAEENRREPESILQTIIQQLVQCGFHDKRLAKPVVDVFQERKRQGQIASSLSLIESQKLLVELTDMYPETIICIDALDEVGEDKRIHLLKALNGVIATSKSLVKIFATTRMDPDIVAQFEIFPRIELKPDDNVNDIDQFITKEVTRVIDDRELLDGKVSDELRSEICKTLSKRSKGMFQLAALQITFLCQLFTEDDVRDNLQTLPDTLKHAYNKIYRNIVAQKGSAPRLALMAFRWIKYSYEPLRSETLLDAISVEVGSSGEFSRTAPIHVNNLLKMCRNLLILDERLDVFRFAHLSVEEYLEKQPELQKANSHAEIASGCLSLLCAPGAWNGYAKMDIEENDYNRNRHLLSYSVVFWPWHFSHCTDLNGCQTLTALWNSFIAESNYQKWLDYHFQWVNTYDWDEGVGFWHRVWHWKRGAHDLDSLVCVFGLSMMLPSVLQSTGNDIKPDLSKLLRISSNVGDLDMASLLVDNGANVHGSDENGWTPLHYASQSRHEKVVQLLIDSGADVSAIDKDGKTPLHCASEKGREGVVKLLIDRGADVSVIDTDGMTPLHHASQSRHEGVVQLLIDRGADISAIDKDEKTPLHYASRWWYKEMVQLLIDRGADVSAIDKDGKTPLHCALQYGHEEVVQLLVDMGANITAIDQHGKTSLHYASEYGYEGLVQLLIDRGADISAINKDGETALHYASRRGNEGVLQLLIDLGANVSAIDEYGKTPLHHASLWGHEEVVQLLIDRGADVSAINKDGETALHYASQRENEGVVQLLIDGGADVSAIDKGEKTPLHYSSWYGREGVVKLLIDRGADVSVIDTDGKTPLHYASIEGYEGVVKLLIHRGADMTAIDKDGRTPLDYALSAGHEGLVKLLKVRGAICQEQVESESESYRESESESELESILQ